MTLFGIFISFKDEHSEKALSAIVFRPSGNIIFSSKLHFSKADFSMVCTLVDIFADASFLQL